MVILDTDLVSLLEWKEHPTAQRLWSRLQRLPTVEISTTIVSFEEQMRGWMAAIAKARQIKDQIDKYRRLRRTLELYCSISIVDFDEHAAIFFQSLKKSMPRAGTMDLKVASMALAHDAILLTRNLQDYAGIHSLKVEDWTRDERTP